jgi:hypothetical protein
MGSSLASKSWGTTIVSSKYAVVVIVIMTAILLTGFGRESAQADTDLVTDISYSPDPAIAGSDLTFSCKLTDETGVENVVLNMCSATFCFPPLIMTKGAGDVWTATSTDVDNVGEYHFNVTVHLTDDSKEWTDDIYFDAVSTDLDTEMLGHVPVEVKVGDEIDVFAQLTDETGVSAVSLFYCEGDLCHNPATMTKLDNGTYHARIGPFDNPDDEVKYNVTVTYEDGHKAWSEDIKFTPAKKSDDKNGDDDDNGIIPALGAVAVLAVMTAFAVTRRGRKRED